MADYGDAIGVYPKQLWPIDADPSICVDEIFDDVIQLGLGGQPIVDCNDRVAGVEVLFGLNGIEPPCGCP